MIIPILDAIQSKIIKKLEIEVVSYNLYTSALINVNYLDVNDEKISNVLVNVDGNEFNIEWNSDQDLINIVCRKLGFTPLAL